MKKVFIFALLSLSQSIFAQNTPRKSSLLEYTPQTGGKQNIRIFDGDMSTELIGNAVLDTETLLKIDFGSDAHSFVESKLAVGFGYKVLGEKGLIIGQVALLQAGQEVKNSEISGLALGPKFVIFLDDEESSYVSNSINFGMGKNKNMISYNLKARYCIPDSKWNLEADFREMHNTQEGDSFYRSELAVGCVYELGKKLELGPSVQWQRNENYSNTETSDIFAGVTMRVLFYEN